MLFRQGDSSNSDYKQRFKENIEVLEAYNGGVLIGNSLRATVREITLLGLNTEIADDVEKAHILARVNNWQTRSSSARIGANMGSGSSR